MAAPLHSVAASNDTTAILPPKRREIHADGGSGVIFFEFIMLPVSRDLIVRTAFVGGALASDAMPGLTMELVCRKAAAFV
jgi:hypothetical protein